jgi:hypothetical protein
MMLKDCSIENSVNVNTKPIWFIKEMKLQEGIIDQTKKNLNNGILWYSFWGDDTEDERNANYCKRRDSKINELTWSKSQHWRKVVS